MNRMLKLLFRADPFSCRIYQADHTDLRERSELIARDATSENAILKRWIT